MDPTVPQMRAETGYELEDSAPPLRLSGFICLILGALSFLSLLGQPLLVLPLLAFVTGAFALRRYSGQKPVGLRPAMVGLVLAAGFGACGFFMPWMKSRTLGKQAEEFSRNYMQVVAEGHEEVAVELRKDHVNRLPTTMSLAEFYSINQDAAEALQEFRDDSLTSTLRRLGSDAEWVLGQPTRVYQSYGKDQAEVIWIDEAGGYEGKIQFFLRYRIDTEGAGQWNIEVAQPYRERIVAEQVL